MKSKDEIELQRVALVRTARTLIRLKHSLQADREIDAVVPKLLARFDQAIEAGDLLVIDLSTLDEVLRGTLEIE